MKKWVKPKVCMEDRLPKQSTSVIDLSSSFITAYESSSSA